VDIPDLLLFNALFKLLVVGGELQDLVEELEDV
jgi:hypothetical protein